MDEKSSRRKAATTLHTVERAFALLEHVATSDDPPTLREAAEALGLNITTGYHMFNTLHALGYLVRTPESTLAIGPRITVLHQAYRREVSTSQDLLRVVESLASVTGETASMSAVVDGQVVIQAISESNQPMRASGLYVGLSGSEHLRASGRLVLAFADDPTRDQIIQKALAGLSPRECAKAMLQLESERASIVDRGWAVDEGAYQPDIAGVAVPIFGVTNELLGTINVSTPAQRFSSVSDKVITAAIEHAKVAARILSEHL